MHKICEYIDDELMELERKVDKSGKLSNAEIEYGKELAEFQTALLTNKAMEEYDDEYSNAYMGGNSYARDDNRSSRYPRSSSYNRGNSYAGRRSNVSRDSMGRYSRDDATDEMVVELHELMNNAPNEKVRKAFKEFIEEMQEM